LFFKKFREKKQQRIRDQSTEALTLTEVLGDSYSAYEGRLSVPKGLLLSPVAAAHRILTNSVGSLPIALYRTEKEYRRRVTDHPTLPVLLGKTGENMTPFMWKKTMMSDCFWYGEAFARPIYDRRGKLESLRHYKPGQVSREELMDGTVCYTLRETDGSSRTYMPDEVIHFLFDSVDGEEGLGILKMARQTIRTDLNAQMYADKFYTNGARPSGILKTDEKLDSEAKSRVRSAFMRMTGGAKNAYTVAVLDRGLTYTPLGISQAEFVRRII